MGLTVSGSTHDITASDTATGTITNDDTAPVTPATVTIADASAEEGDALTFTVILDNAVQGGFTVTPSFTDSTATTGTDYTANTTALSFTGTAGETQTFTVTTTEDQDVEGNETFTVGLAVSGTPHSVTASDTATGTITNDDTAPVIPATVTIAGDSAEEGDALIFTVTLDNAVQGGFTVTPSFTDGTATQATDYTANTAPFTFAGTVGETRMFTVSTVEDEEVEQDETFTVGLAVSGTTHSVTASDTATGTIRNDDSLSPPVETPVTSAAITIGDVMATEGETLAFSVTLDKAVPGGFTVTPRFTDGTAMAGADYSANANTLNFNGTAGETVTLSVATINDAVEEGPEIFTAELTVSDTLHDVSVSGSATGTILDDDFDYAAAVQGAEMTSSGNVTTVKSPTFSFSSLQYECKVPNTVVESTRTLRIACAGTLSLSNPYNAFYGARAQIWNATPPGTATSGSGANWDWRIENEKLLFKPLDSRTQYFNIKLNDDALTEGPETIKFRLKWTTLTQGVRFHESIHTVTVTIEEPTLTVSPAHVVEEDGAKTVTVTAGVTGKVSANETLSINVGAGTAPSATEGTDYQNVGSFNITIPSGSNKGTGTFTLTPIDDNHYEQIEWITVSGSEVVSTDISITDGDQPAVTLSATPAQLVEGSGATTVTVGATVSPTITVDRKVRLLVGKTGDSALYVTDYAVSPREFDLTIPANQSSASRTITLTAKDDSTTEGAEQFTIDGVSANTAFTSTQVEILDRPVVKLSVDTTTVAETAAATTVTVTAALEDPKTRDSRTRAGGDGGAGDGGRQRRFGDLGHGLRRGVGLHHHHSRR